MRKNGISVVFYYEHHTNDIYEKELIKNLLRRYNISIFGLKYKKLYFLISMILTFVALLIMISILNYAFRLYENELQILNIYSVLPILTISILLISAIIVFYIGYIFLQRAYDVYHFIEGGFIENYRILTDNPLETSGILVEVKHVSGLLREVIYTFEINGKTIYGHYSTNNRDWLDIEAGQKITVNYVNDLLHIPIIVSATTISTSLPL
ncbi:MAG: hypothetical protein Phog2KO_42630 [Phototrophicaceae bacterium]